MEKCKTCGKERELFDGICFDCISLVNPKRALEIGNKQLLEMMINVGEFMRTATPEEKNAWYEKQEKSIQKFVENIIPEGRSFKSLLKEFTDQSDWLRNEVLRLTKENLTLKEKIEELELKNKWVKLK